MRCTHETGVEERFVVRGCARGAVAGLLLVALAGGLSGCDRPGSASDASEATAVGHSGRSDLQASTVTVDSSGQAPPQPSPYGGDTAVGAAGVEGASPSSREAAASASPAADRPNP